MGHLHARVGVRNLTASPTRPKRIGGLVLRSVDLLPEETLVRAGWARYLWAPLLGSYNSRLYLTNRRLCFLPLRWGFPQSANPPIAGRALILELKNIREVGPAPPQMRLIFWEDTWYIESQDERHYFGTSKFGSGSWVDVIARTADIPIGRPLALYS